MRAISVVCYSIAFPTLIQFISSSKRRAYGLFAGLIGFVCIYCWLGFIYSPIGFWLLIGAVLFWWVFVVVDALWRRANIETYYDPLPFCCYGFLIATCLFSLTGLKRHVLGFEVFKIPTASMSPSINPGDFVLVDTFSNQLQELLQGEIVVFKRANVFYIKRYIAGENSKINASGHHLIAGNYRRRYRERFEPKQWNTSEAEFFVVGDNSAFSQDSRFFGSISTEQLIGKYRFTLRRSKPSAN